MRQQISPRDRKSCCGPRVDCVKERKQIVFCAALRHIRSVNTGIQTERYAQVAQREIQTGSPRQPQWTQAVDEASGDTKAATQHYVSTRITEISGHEVEHEAAEERLRKLRRYYDEMTFPGGLKFALFAVPLILVVVSWVYWLISK